ncbi:FG-GAP repeat domain-containing protein [Engelhardtia mirabilis]|uniref:FG-GAP repeat protein n=1 Tax=Engelhardtia mirabilis TaxID=2528011 RepID=A0A518BJB7_9BACT|nr:FG-GAP repeat protein [Planctomycetes bacterium Pla133]QDV01406.1 FG-GAP repeat protein [Planctomycetes bacterium Pla86]
MDVNGDGRIDLLSGSYSRMEEDMAGLFWVLPGLEGGGFGEPETLLGTDGEPLIISGVDESIGKICTRPTAVDFDGDGHLDIVSGNFEGTFHLFRGAGNGAFAPDSVQLTRGGEPLVVEHHSDPVFFDWDGDGDLDLVSGSVRGIDLFEHTGAGPADFAEPVELFDVPVSRAVMSGQIVFGEGHIDGPQGSLRVWVDDVDGDGRFDLLVGDCAQVTTPGEGLDEAAARERLDAWDLREAEFMERFQAAGSEWTDELTADYQALWDARGEILHEDGTGFVWFLRQLPPSES